MENSKINMENSKNLKNKIKKVLNKKINPKVSSIIALAAILIFGAGTYLALASHTHSATVSPEWAKGNTSTEYTVTITNSSGDNIEWVKITKPASFGNVTCGSAPTGWALESSAATYCVYATPVDYITLGNSEAFTLTTTTDALTGTYTWQTKTKDINEVYDTQNPTSKVDADNPITATVTAPSNTSYYNAGSMPSTFQGVVADNNGGSGLSASSAVFYIKDSNNKYWDGDSWEALESWLATTHEATTGDTEAIWTDDISLPSWTDGTYYVKAKATDKVGNILEGTEISFVYDTTAPVAPVITLLDPINSSNKTAVTITGTGEANASINYSIDDTENIGTNPITGTGTVNAEGTISITGIDVSSLDDGILIASVILTDAAGNEGSAGTDTATKDTIAPDAAAALTFTAVGGTVVTDYVNTTNTNFTGGATITAGQATGGYAEWLIGDSAFSTPIKDLTIEAGDTSVTFDAGLTSNVDVQTQIASGARILKVKLCDAAGNCTTSTATKSITADYVVPTISSVQYYSDADLTSSLGDNPKLKAGTYYLKITSSETLSGTPTITIDAEGTANDVTDAATASVSGNDYKYTRTITTDVAAVGSVLEDISITGTDSAGNTATNVNPTNEATKAAYTDTTAPILSSATRDSDTQITVTLSELADVDTITKENDGGFIVTETGDSEITYTVLAITPGSTNDKVVLTVANMLASGKEGVTVTYTAGGNGTVADVAGNAMVGGQSVNISPWTRTAVPTVTTPGSAVTVNAGSYTVAGTATAGATVKIYADVDDNGVADSATALNFTTATTEGNFSLAVSLSRNTENNFVVTATEEGKDESNAVNVPTITEDSIPPVVVIQTPLNGHVISDDTSILTYEITGGTVSDVKVDGVSIGTPESGTELTSLTTGSHTIRIDAIDEAGNKGSDENSFTVDLSTPPMPTATTSSGIYTSTQTVYLESDEGATIYYTTDESDPATSSTVYVYNNLGITIDKDTILKAMAVGQNGNTSPIVTYTYIIKTDLVGPTTQTITLAPGWNIFSVPKWVESFEATGNEIAPATTLTGFIGELAADGGVANIIEGGVWKNLYTVITDGKHKLDNDGSSQEVPKPLYGYIINNKSGADITLTVTYMTDSQIANKGLERYFQRTLSAGWNSVGISEPQMSLSQDTENILNVDTSDTAFGVSFMKRIIDYTDNLSSSTAFATSGETLRIVERAPNPLNPRETKGYQIFISEGATLAGSQEAQE